MDRFRRLPTWVGVVLLIIGAAALAQGIGPWHPAVFWGVALIGVGLLLFFKGTDRDERGPSTLPPGTAGPMAPPPAISAGPAAYAAPTTTVPLPPPGQATVSAAPAVGVPRRRERSSLGWITIGTLLVAIAVAVLLDSAGAISLSLAQYLALAISVLGLGLLAGARWGRARWLIAPAILLVPPLLAASLVQVPLRGGVGQRYYRPAAESDVGSVYRLAVGQLVVDLRDVPFGSQHRHLTVTVGLGQVQVVVPRNVSIVVVARSGAGQASLFDQIYDGLKVDVTRTYEPPGASGQLQLDIEAGLGQVVLTHEPQNLS